MCEHACLHLHSVLFCPGTVTLLQEVFVLTRPDKSMLTKWRSEAAVSGFHRHICIPVPKTLDREVANELRGIDLEGLRAVDLQKLARLHGREQG